MNGFRSSRRRSKRNTVGTRSITATLAAVPASARRRPERDEERRRLALERLGLPRPALERPEAERREPPRQRAPAQRLRNAAVAVAAEEDPSRVLLPTRQLLAARTQRRPRPQRTNRLARGLRSSRCPAITTPMSACAIASLS